MLQTAPPTKPLPPPQALGALPRGLRGLLAISFLSVGRGMIAGYLLGLLCIGAWIACLATDAPRPVSIFTALVLVPAGILIVPVVGVLQGQRLSDDYRQLDTRTHVRLWLLRGRGLRSWPLPAGALTDPAIRRSAGLIAGRAGPISALSRGARAALTGELRAALREAGDAAAAAALIDETIDRVSRWEAAAAGLPPVGAKLYLRHDALGRRAAQARRTAARLGVPSDTLNYFWKGQVLLLPPCRSYRTLASLIDALIDAGVANADRPLPLQITVQGALGDDAKLIALAQLLASGLDLTIEGPERRGDEGNLIARGRRPPEAVAGDGGRERTDFLFSLVWAAVPEMAAAGYAEQHHRDLRVVQSLAAALLAAGSPVPRGRTTARLAAVWQEFARVLCRLCAAWGAGDAVTQTYLDVPFVEVRPTIERLLARKAADPDLCVAARRLRDRALALVELQDAVTRIGMAGRVCRVRLGRVGGGEEWEYSVRGGLRRARRAIRAGGRVVVVTRATDTIRILLDD